MDWSIPDVTGRIAIPSRDYKKNSNTVQNPSPAINRPPSSQSNQEEKKIQLPARPYQQPAPSIQPVQSFQSLQPINTQSKSLNQNLKQKFEELRRNIDKKLEIRLKQAEEDYKKRVKEIKQDSDQEKNDLFLLEQLALAESSYQVAPSLKPAIPKDLIQALEPSKKPSSVSSKTPEVILLGYNNQDSWISKDLQTIQPLKTPKDFSKGGGLLSLKNKNVLIVYGNGKASLLNLSQNQLKNLPIYPQPRTYFTLAMIGKNPAVIGGLLNSGTCSVVSVLKNLNYWDDGLEINVPRSHARSIKHRDSTYLFAGFSGGFVNSIEMFSNEWIELNVMMPANINHFGLCTKGNEIFIFGGEDSGSVFRSVYSFDTTCEKFSKKKNLGENFSCRNDDCVRLVDEEFFLLNVQKSNVLKYFPG